MYKSISSNLYMYLMYSYNARSYSVRHNTTKSAVFCFYYYFTHFLCTIFSKIMLLFFMIIFPPTNIYVQKITLLYWFVVKVKT